MLNRRLFVGGLSASVPLILLPGAAGAQGRQPRLHAMVVGINDYLSPIKPLKGCVNDANDLEAQIKPLDPNVRKLLGAGTQRVTRAAFFSAWNAMLAEARQGDTLLISFSGHGTQIPGNEPDGMDETLVLSGYRPSDARDRAEHIIDDEIDKLARDAHARELILVFIADCCHSGGVHRTVEQRDVSYRTLDPFARGIGRPNPGPTAPSAPPGESPPNLLFLAASQENELVPEIPVDGRPRGALSVAVARAFEGGRAARDGVITAYGLTEFVFRHVESLSDSGHHPDVTWPTTKDVRTIERNTPLVVLGGSPPAPPPPAATGSVRLRIQGLGAGEQERILLRDAILVGEQDEASLVWDARTKLILNDQRHRIAEEVEASQLQYAIDRRLALERLIQMSAGNALSLRIRLPHEAADAPPSAASDATHKGGAVFDCIVGRIENNAVAGAIPDNHYYVLFNLTGNGKVQMLEPYPRGHPPSFEAPEFRTGLRKERGVQITAVRNMLVQRQGPFGAEHIVAIAGRLPLNRLMAALRETHEKFAVTATMEGLVNESKVQPLRVGFKGIYSAP
jgi:hypothetical protein